GTAVFEGIRAYETSDGLSIFRLKEHMHRLKDSAHAYMMPLPYSESDLCEVTTTLLAKNEMRDSTYIRPIVFKAVGGISLDFTRVPTWTAVVAFPYEKYFEKEGLDVCVSSWRRTSEPSVLSLVKASGHYINSVLAKVEAARNGFDEAIFLDQRGFVSEGSGENIFIVKKGIIHTPPLSAGILEGITRDTLCTIAQDYGMKLQERDIARGELYTCDEAFFTGTAAGISPILSIDRREIGGHRLGPVTQQVQELYSEVVSGNNERYAHWLTPVYPKIQRKATAEVTTIASVHSAALRPSNWQLQFWEWTRPQGP
ncbi:MAG TPA: branched-chain amino acid transaminase, partial [Candidatus Acidoferrum sp.]|nr:branched-chain amino acid transaminase [Candidatus Acidoferrum sp.]